MTLDYRPKQPDFKPVSEEWGRVTLEDGTSIETRIILSDLTIAGEDILGAHFATSTVVALRAKALQKVKNLVKDAQLMIPGSQLPLTEEAGYEKTKIKKVNKPTKSSYRFNGRLLNLELEIHAIVRNLSIKTPSGAPVYHVRWSVNSKIVEESES